MDKLLAYGANVVAANYLAAKRVFIARRFSRIVP